MKQQILVVRGRNDDEELTDHLNARLAALPLGWRIVSAITTMEPWGEMEDGTGMKNARQIYLVATVVVEWPS